MNAQRALWTFLIYSLVAPFFGALTLVAVVILAGAFGLSYLLPAGLPPLGTVGLGVFVWAILPAVLAAVAFAILVVRQGGFGWVVAAVTGVLAFAIAVVLFPLPELAPLRPYFAFFAGLVAVVLREVLLHMGVLEP